MATLLHQVRLPYTTQLPRDVAVNTFWTLGGGDRLDQAVEAEVAITRFYNEDNTNNHLSYWLSPLISRQPGACIIQTYDLADPQPRPPISQVFFQLGAPGTNTSLPMEVALVASFHGEPAAGIRQARRRGRVYLGPLITAAAESGSNQPSRPHSTFIVDVRDACSRLASELNGEDDAPQWIVHSRVSSNNAPVIGGWVDNEWDTQRRRGLDPTARTTWGSTV